MEKLRPPIEPNSESVVSITYYLVTNIYQRTTNCDVMSSSAVWKGKNSRYAVMPAWGECEISTYLWTHGLSNIYDEAIIIKKILMQVL